MKYLLEVCVNSIQSGIIAQNCGANRIELCEHLEVGGTTPSHGMIELALEKISIPIHVLIRPRKGNFVYDETDFEIIKRDIQFCKKLNIPNVVTGILTRKGDVDVQRMKELLELANPTTITFHRAFDVCRKPFEALEQLIETGIVRILTSGHKKTAPEGIDEISKLVFQAENRMTIMPGSGVNEHNIRQLRDETKAIEFHTSCSQILPEKTESANREVSFIMQGINENEHLTASANRLKNTIKQLHSQELFY